MAERSNSYDKIIKEFFAWAKKLEGMRAAVIIGSRARTDHPADKWSDLDIVVFVDEPQKYLSDSAWLDNFGNIVLTFTGPAGDRHFMEHRVIYEGGLDVDFTLVPLGMIGRMLDGDLPVDLYNAFGRGAKVLFDKDGLVQELINRDVKKPFYQPPAKKDFVNAINDFWFHAVWTAKHLRRGEIWWAKMCLDCHMKSVLSRMFEWHARAKKGKSCDTWLRGRFLEEWADPRAVKDLENAFARYDKADIWRCLINTMDLFRSLAKEAAQSFKYPYPTEADKYTTATVLELELEEDEGKGR
jgi:aminoglycoside 6-adenylyltransferase